MIKKLLVTHITNMSFLMAVIIFTRIVSAQTIPEHTQVIDEVQKHEITNADRLPPIEDELFGVPIGSTVDILGERFVRLYQHTLSNGEILHATCNQEALEVFTFVEEPWSLGYITYLAARKVYDESICRDEQGSLPDYGVPPVTPRDVRLGDTEDKIIEKYGAPDEKYQVDGNDLVLIYKGEDLEQRQSVENLTLHFRLTDNQVIGFSLAADIPGMKTPATHNDASE